MSRRPVILLGILVVAAVLAFLLEARRSEQPEAPAPLLGIDADDVVALEVLAGPRVLRARRDPEADRRPDGGWSVSEPPGKGRSAGAAVAALVGSLTSLVSVDGFTREDVHLRAFGLEPARIRVTLSVQGLERPRVLLLGDDSPSGGSVYGIVSGDSRVHLVGAILLTEIDKTFYHVEHSS